MRTFFIGCYSETARGKPQEPAQEAKGDSPWGGGVGTEPGAVTVTGCSFTSLTALFDLPHCSWVTLIKKKN